MRLRHCLPTLHSLALAGALAGSSAPTLAAKSGVTFHLPPGPDAGSTVSGCPAESTDRALECWSGNGTNLVIRSSPGNGTAPQAVEEVWILGTPVHSKAPITARAGGIEPSAPLQESTETSPRILHPRETEVDIAVPSRLNELLTIVRSAPDPAERTQAVAQLTAVDRNSDLVRTALRTALADRAPSVRVQAVAALSRDFDDWEGFALQQALTDEHPSVRLMAVDRAGNDRLALEQALADSDRIVRTLAARKLRELPPR